VPVVAPLAEMPSYNPVCSSTGMMHLGDQECSFWPWEAFIALFHSSQGLRLSMIR